MSILFILWGSLLVLIGRVGRAEINGESDWLKLDAKGI